MGTDSIYMAEYGHTGPPCTSNIYYITWLHFRRISGTVASNFSGLVAKGRRKLRIAVVGNVGRNDRISLSGQDLRDRASPATGFPYRPAQAHMSQQSLGDPFRRGIEIFGGPGMTRRVNRAMFQHQGRRPFPWLARNSRAMRVAIDSGRLFDAGETAGRRFC